MGLIQLPLQIALGIMTGERFFYSVLALLPLLLSMPVGAWLGRRLSPVAFDRVILVLLTGLAARLLFAAVT